jgi:4-hydroxy-tetrahydrodipicolinate synthase
VSIERGGAFPVLPTIFDATGAIDHEGFRAVVEYTIAAGVDGVVFPGLASEYAELSIDERLALIEIVGQLAADRVTYVVGASGRQDEESLALIKAGRRVGASVAMIMSPARHGCDVDRLAAFYDRMAEAGLPIMLQNAPAPMGSALAIGDVHRLVAAVPAITHVKEENMPCGQRISELLARRPANLAGVFGGAGGRYLPDELARGAIGTMPAAELPEINVAMVAAGRRGDWDLLRAIHERVLPILMLQAIFRWDLTKAILKRRGVIDCPHVRAPGPRMDNRDHGELAALLRRLDMLTLDHVVDAS